MEPPGSPRLARASAAPGPPDAWESFNHQQLNRWLRHLHEQAPTSRRVAVFDWDGTSYAGDSAPLLFEHAIASLQLKLSPERLATMLPGRAMTTLAGVDRRALHDDIVRAYTALWPLMQQDPQQRMRAFTLPAYQDFRCKAGWLTRAFCGQPNLPDLDAYEWVSWLAGHTEAGIAALATEAYDALQSLAPRGQSWACATPGTAGTLTYTRETKAQVRPELLDLMLALQETGTEVWLVSANLRPLVASLAKHLGYPVPTDRIVGSQAQIATGETDATGETLTGRMDPHAILPFMAGKTRAIQALVQAAPILVAGDTNGDAAMLSDFTETQIKLVFDNRLPGPIAAQYDAAAAYRRDARALPATLLQAVDPHTGALVATERSPLP